MLRRIRIVNFKSLRDVTVELEPVTVLIGRSGTGKSNFVQAIRFLRDFLMGKGLGAADPLGGWQRVLCATRKTAVFSFEVDFEVPGLEGGFSYVLQFQAKQGNQVTFKAESLSRGGQAIFAQDSQQWQRPPDLLDAPKPGNPVFGSLYGIPEARIAHVVLTKGLGCYDFPGNVLQGRAHSAGETGLFDDAGNYLTALDAITTNVAELDREKEMRAALQRLNPSVTSVELVADRSHVRVGHKVGDGKVLTFDLAQESEGFRRFLAHLIALYQQPPKQVLAFEEPEKGIYPGALSVLAEYFRAVADSGRSQVILTTHSPQLLKEFQPQQMRVVTLDGYDTNIGPLAAEQREALEEHLLTGDELLTVDEPRRDAARPST